MMELFTPEESAPLLDLMTAKSGSWSVRRIMNIFEGYSSPLVISVQSPGLREHIDPDTLRMMMRKPVLTGVN